METTLVVEQTNGFTSANVGHELVKRSEVEFRHNSGCISAHDVKEWNLIDPEFRTSKQQTYNRKISR